MGIPWDGMGWDGTAMNCYGMGWDGTEKYVPWTSLVFRAQSTGLDVCECLYMSQSLFISCIILHNAATQRTSFKRK